MKKSFLGALIGATLGVTVCLALGSSPAYAAEYSSWHDGLELTDGDTVVIDGTTYAYGGDASEGLTYDDDYGPGVDTIWTAGEGYILFDYDEYISEVEVTLHNITIDATLSTDSYGLWLPMCPATMVIEGTNNISSYYAALANWKGFVTYEELTILGDGSLNAEAECEGINIARPTFINSGNITAKSSDYDAILSQGEYALTIAGGELSATTYSEDFAAYISYHDGIVVTGGKVSLVNAAGGNAILIDAAEDGKVTVSGGEVNLTGDIYVEGIDDVRSVTDTSQYVDVDTDAVTGTILESSIMMEKGNRYAYFDVAGNLIKSGAYYYDFNDEDAYDTDATVDEDGYKIEWTYDEADVVNGYKLTVGEALDAYIILPGSVSGTVEIAGDIDIQNLEADCLFNADGSSASGTPSVTFTGSGTLITDVKLGDFYGIDVVIDGLSIEITSDDDGIDVVSGNLTIKDSTIDIKGAYDTNGIDVGYGDVVIENSKIKAYDLDDGIDVGEGDLTVKDNSTIEVVGIEEDSSSTCISLYYGYITIEDSIIKAYNVACGLYLEEGYIRIKGESTIDVVACEEYSKTYGIYVEEGGLTIDESKAKLVNVQCGLELEYAELSIENNSIVEIEGNEVYSYSCAIGTTEGSAYIQSSNVTAKNVSDGIYTYNGNVHILDGSIFEVTCTDCDEYNTAGIFVEDGIVDINSSTIDIVGSEFGIYAYDSVNDDAKMNITDSIVHAEGEIRGISCDNEIIIDHSDCTAVARNEETGIGVYSDIGIQLLNIVNGDDYEVKLYDSNAIMSGYTIYYGGERAASLEIQIYKVASIEVSKTKKEYTVGETLSLEDLVVTATYSDGTSSAVTGFTTNASALDMSTAGHKVLTVSYSEDGITVTKDFTFTVVAQEPDDAPDTGDMARNGVMCLVMILAAVGAVVCSRRRETN